MDGAELRALWDFEDPVGSETRFRAAIPDTDPVTADVLRTQVARAQGLQERYDEAAALLSSIRSEHPEVRTRVALEQGRVLRSSGDPEAAGPLFDAAARLAHEHGLAALEVDALHMVALVQGGAARLATTEQALALARASADPEARRWEGSLLHNLGMAHADAGDWERALPVFEESLVVRRTQGDAVGVQVARWSIGWSLRHLGRTGEALAVQRALKADLDAAGRSDEYVEEELAELGTDDVSR